MSDDIKHECGIALVRLLKPLDYYIQKYGTATFGLDKLYLLMEKQRNRGQDGAGVGAIKFDLKPGMNYIDRRRSITSNAIPEIFGEILSHFEKVYKERPHDFKNAEYLKENVPFAAELLLGHLRYATHSDSGTTFLHPRLRSNNWKSRNLLMAGNFNMTNNDELFELLINIGQHPKDRTDTVTVMEKIGHFLDEANQELFDQYKSQGHSHKTISNLIADHLDVGTVLRKAVKDFDGGFAMAGLIGHGDAFLFRDPSGIRPAFFYANDEVVVAASERPAIQTAFNVKYHEIQEIDPGKALIIKRNGTILHEAILDPLPKKSCSFERIYFSRGTDRDIYQERKNLGRLLTPAILSSVGHDFEHTIFSFVPNTAEIAFLGLCEGLHDTLAEWKRDQLNQLGNLNDAEAVWNVLKMRPRIEKIPIKDAKLRTFISADKGRNELVSHVYDTTYGVIRRGVDTLVVMDDSIVRGTTLRRSILSILNRLGPRRIVVVSSAPQIRYPDCYGIDMSKLGDFVAFKAAIDLLKERHQSSVIEEVYKLCKTQEYRPKEEVTNAVKRIYEPFSPQEISDKIADIVRPENMDAEVDVIFQSIENLHEACPNHKGDWYFTGDYPTPGGNRVANKSFINFYERRNERSY
ncbi:MAG: amidophosphoribosyltransferase [Bacteroidetes bacterium]|nr:amidophosphoribosyltransferase [Bacteroidota bacterium]